MTLKGHTPYISKFKLSIFYDDLKYLALAVKFPKSKTFMGKVFGIDPDKGDTLVYISLMDCLGNGQSIHYLVQFLVDSECHPNHRTGLVRNFPHNMVPFDDHVPSPKRIPCFSPVTEPLYIHCSARVKSKNNGDPLLRLRKHNLAGQEQHEGCTIR